MTSSGLLVRLEAKPGKDAEVEAFLHTAVPMVRQQADTTAWFAVRFGRSEYGIFDVFPDEASRAAHLAGPVSRALMDKVGSLLTEPPRIQLLEVLADKLPISSEGKTDTKALLLTFKAKAGHEEDVEEFLRGAQEIVGVEPATTAWFAIRLDDGEYGIFDVFPDNSGRFAHLTGHVPRELAKQSLTLLGSIPDLNMLNVLEEELAS
ncbi:MAG: hypothetical protein ACAI44_12590 [Candidatus Sericytochromatia bacterium]